MRVAKSGSNGRKFKSAAVVVQQLEDRRLLSAGPMASIGPVVLPVPVAPPPSSTGTQPTVNPAVATAPFTPAQIRQFYGANAISFNGTAGTGAGQTIAIIDALNQPDITTDLANFDSQFGLPAPPSFKIENQTGGTSLPTGYNSGDAFETSLDVEWAHSMAPGANLLLIECNSLSYADLLQTGVNTANNTAGVSVVTMSFGGSEFSSQSSYDSYFTHTGITYLASTGDTGAAGTGYPSTSSNVVAVGGTAITASDNIGSYGSEVVWNSSPASSDSPGATGGGISGIESKPSYQSGVTQSTTQRTVPDVAFEASVDTGVYILDTSQPDGGGYYFGGGTSLAAPSWAGLIADADQGRTLAGKSALSGNAQTLPRLYQLPSADFHDITSGNNNYNNTGGYNASSGYDLASGIGTPVANKLVADLAGSASVTGQVFVDKNADGTFDGTDTALTGQAVYLDLNNDGIHESNEPTAVVNASGVYTINAMVTGGDLLGGLTGTVRPLTTPPGYVAVGAGATFSTSYNTASTANVGLFPIAYTDATPGNAYTVRVSPTDPTQLQILVNGTLTYNAPVTLAPSLAFNFTASNESLTVDFGNGNPIPAGGLSFNGSAAANNDALTILGTAGNDAIAVNAASVTFGSSTITYNNVPNLVVDPGGGTDSLSASAVAVTVPAAAAGGGVKDRAFSSLSVTGGATITFGTAASQTDRTLIQTATVSVTGSSRLAIGGNDMDVSTTPLATVQGLVAAGYNYTGGANWQGATGITSSVAAADSTHLTAVGVIGNNQSGSPLFSAAKTFDGIVPGAGDALVKLTYFGDANFSGKVDGSDYSLIDAGYAARGSLTGWYNGDFNFDGVVDGSDYALIDNTVNNQRTAFPSALVAASTASVAGAPAVATPARPAKTVPSASPRFVPSAVVTAIALPQPAVFGVDVADDDLDLLKSRGKNAGDVTGVEPMNTD